MRTWLLALLLVSGTIIAYLPVWHAGLIWDDRTFVVDNPLIRRADGLYRFWFTTLPVDYFPLTSTTWWLEWRLWGTSPLGYHVVNVLLHSLSVVVLWRVLKRLSIPGSWLAAALFAVHPVNVESVAWIAERKNTLAMVFYLLSLLCYLRVDPAPSPPPPAAPSAGVGQPITKSFASHWYWLSLAAFLLAMLSKTAVAPMPLVLFGLAWLRRGRVERREVWQSVPFFVTAAAVGLISWWFQSHRAIGPDIVRTDSVWARLAGAGWAVWFYLFKAALPFGLSPVYPRWEIDAGQWWSYVPGLAVVAGLWTCWRTSRRWGRGPLAGLGYFVVMLLPVLGFLDISFMMMSLVADRWQYFAIIGPIALGVAVVTTARERAGPMIRYSAGVAAGALLAVFGGLTWRQSEIYADPETFWQATLTANPNAWIAHNNLGCVFRERGQLEEARTHFEKALEMEPTYQTAHFNLAGVLRLENRSDEAIAHYQRAVDIDPDFADAHRGLGIELVRKGRVEEALVHFQRALEIDPNRAEDHHDLAGVLWGQGRVQEAITHYKKALQIRPAYALAHYNLGTLLEQQGQAREAIAHYERAVELQPEFAAACASLAWVLATSPDASVRSGARAIGLAAEAQRLSGGSDPRFMATLAAAYAEGKRFSEAISTSQQALQVAMSQKNEVLANRLREQIALYQAGSPYRDTKPAGR
jgi:tetratricopeptide (TPR) repeat protein